MIYLDEIFGWTNKKSHEIWMDYLDGSYKLICCIEMTDGETNNPQNVLQILFLKLYPQLSILLLCDF